jgi:hypothetical protein
MGFLEYTDVSFRAFVHSEKQQEIAQRKHSIVKSVYDYHRSVPQSVLFIGFNPAMLLCEAQDVYATEISAEAEEWLANAGLSVKVISAEDLYNYGKNFDAVVAMEEYFTFTDSETGQKALFEMICQVTRKIMITTLRDYKNQEFKDREFSMPAVVKNSHDDLIFLEHHDYNDPDRNVWNRSVYEIAGDQMRSNQGFRCRHMFFKQCAKFGYDAGALEFLVHKNLMYKSLIKKNYEHVISIKFG